MPVNRTVSTKHPLHPEGEQLEILLHQFQPHPSKHFYQRMSRAPWKKQSNSLWIQFRGRFQSLSIPAYAALIIFFLIIINLTSPSIEVVAQKIAQFFSPSSVDRVTVEVRTNQITTPQSNFPLTIEEAEEKAGFRALLPQFLPLDFNLSGANYTSDLQAIVVDYTSPSHNQVLRVSQGVSGFEQAIGSNTVVEVIPIGSGNGEYVVGAWKIPEILSILESTEPNISITLEASWDSGAKIQVLRWQEGDMLYEILYGWGGNDTFSHLGKNDLIKLAESITKID